MKRWIAIGLLGMSSVIFGFMWSEERAENEKLNLVIAVSNQAFKGVQKDFEEYRRTNMPREFATKEAFASWVKSLALSVGTQSSWRRAINIQMKGYEDGYLVGYQAVVNGVTQGWEFWPSAKIGDEVYVIEPLTNIVTLYYPSPWWR